MSAQQSNKLRNTQKQETRVTKFYRSFSGTDALVFAVLPQTEPILIGSLSTLSYSMYRDKKPVPVIGRINMGGYTRGVRLYAGTMIFTLINQHWINELKDYAPWIENVGVQKIDELPLMDLMIVCANEYGAAMQMMLYGVEITEEGQVISVENLFTENTFSFVARDLSNFSNEFLGGKGDTLKIEPMVKFNQFGITQLNTNFTPTYTQGPYELGHRHDFNPSYMMKTEELKKVQEFLNHEAIISDTKRPIEINGIYDYPTFEAVKQFQSQTGAEITGELDDETYDRLKDYIDKFESGEDMDAIFGGHKTALVTSSTGASVRERSAVASKSVYHYNQNEVVEVLAEDTGWLMTSKGYIKKSQVSFVGNDYQHYFAPLTPSASEPTDLINAIQSALSVEETGVLDDQTVEAIKQYQIINQIIPSGCLDEETWLTFKEEFKLKDHEALKKSMVELDFLTPVGVSRVDYQKLISTLEEYGVEAISEKENQILLSVIVAYPNEAIEIANKELTLRGKTKTSFTLKEFAEQLIYSIKQQSIPKRVEFIFYPENQIPYKWLIHVEKGASHV